MTCRAPTHDVQGTYPRREGRPRREVVALSPLDSRRDLDPRLARPPISAPSLPKPPRTLPARYQHVTRQ